MMVFNLERRTCSVGYLYVPAHVGVEANDVADRAGLGFGGMECHSIISERLIQQWQQEWSEDTRGSYSL